MARHPCCLILDSSSRTSIRKSLFIYTLSLFRSTLNRQSSCHLLCPSMSIQHTNTIFIIYVLFSRRGRRDGFRQDEREGDSVRRIHPKVMWNPFSLWCLLLDELYTSFQVKYVTLHKKDVIVVREMEFWGLLMYIESILIAFSFDDTQRFQCPPILILERK